jgi:hypothetical protein
MSHAEYMIADDVTDVADMFIRYQAAYNFKLISSALLILCS